MAKDSVTNHSSGFVLLGGLCLMFIVGLNVLVWSNGERDEPPRPLRQARNTNMKTAVHQTLPPIKSGPEEPEIEESKVPKDDEGYMRVTFKELHSFPYVPLMSSEDSPNEQIPPHILYLDGKWVRIDGSLDPRSHDMRGVRRFLLTPGQSDSECCVRKSAVVTGWIKVFMAKSRRTDAGGPSQVRVYGKLEVGEKFERGIVSSLYRMTAVKVELSAIEPALPPKAVKLKSAITNRREHPH